MYACKGTLRSRSGREEVCPPVRMRWVSTDDRAKGLQIREVGGRAGVWTLREGSKQWSESGCLERWCQSQCYQSLVRTSSDCGHVDVGAEVAWERELPSRKTAALINWLCSPKLCREARGAEGAEDCSTARLENTFYCRGWAVWGGKEEEGAIVY